MLCGAKTDGAISLGIRFNSSKRSKDIALGSERSRNEVITPLNFWKNPNLNPVKKYIL